MFHSDLREEIRYLTARLSYKRKRLDDLLAAGGEAEQIALLQEQIKELEEKILLCRTEADAQDEQQNDEWANT